jgi:hypothetical protein
LVAQPGPARDHAPAPQCHTPKEPLAASSGIASALQASQWPFPHHPIFHQVGLQAPAPKCPANTPRGAEARTPADSGRVSPAGREDRDISDAISAAFANLTTEDISGALSDAFA